VFSVAPTGFLLTPAVKLCLIVSSRLEYRGGDLEDEEASNKGEDGEERCVEHELSGEE
jgi:hypothetical protein